MTSPRLTWGRLRRLRRRLEDSTATRVMPVRLKSPSPTPPLRWAPARLWPLGLIPRPTDGEASAEASGPLVLLHSPHGLANAVKWIVSERPRSFTVTVYARPRFAGPTSTTLVVALPSSTPIVPLPTVDVPCELERVTT